MKLAGILGFITGTAIVVWTFLRSLSQTAPDEPDPLDAVQTADPYIVRLTIDCE